MCEAQNLEDNLPKICAKEKSFWKSLWKVQVTGKIKHFLWKACSYSLATKENLVKRKILNDAIYQCCLSDSEDTLHSLWSCNSLKEVWEKDFSWVFKTEVEFKAFLEFKTGVEF